MRLLSHNVLRNTAKGVVEGFPLKIEAQQIEVRMVAALLPIDLPTRLSSTKPPRFSFLSDSTAVQPSYLLLSFNPCLPRDCLQQLFIGPASFLFQSSIFPIPP